MLYIGEKVGLVNAQEHRRAAARALRRGGHRGRSARGHEPVRDRRAERHRGARGVEPRRAAARARSLHGEAGRRPELEGRGQPRRAGAENLKAIARCLGRQRRGSGGRRARARAPRKADRRHSRDRRAHPADRRRRSVGRHRRGGRRLRRARGDGHRRRARKACSPRPRCAASTAKSSRASSSASRSTKSAAARWGSPTSRRSTASKDLAPGQGHHLRRDRRHRRHADARRPVLRRRHPHQLGDHAEPIRTASGSSTASTCARTPTSRSGSESMARGNGDP